MEYPGKEDDIDGRDICKEESGITETVVLSGPYSSDLPKLNASRDWKGTQCEWYIDAVHR